MKNNTENFNLDAVIHELKHYLPSQTPLKDFIHHNSLHAFQHMPFYEAIFTSSAIFGHQATFNLNEYRKLYEIGRIRHEILEQVVLARKRTKRCQSLARKGAQAHPVKLHGTPYRSSPAILERYIQA